MVSVILLEGLKRALANGESLNQAMLSFYRAGYKKESVEEAARALQNQQITPQVPYTPVQKTVKKAPEKKSPKQTFQQISKPIQRVSNYGENKDESIKKIKQGINRAIEDLNKIEIPNNSPQKTVAPVKKKLPLAKNVSDYGVKPKKKTAIIVLGVILAILLLGLGATFLFKEQVLNFFDNSSFFSGLFG